MYRISDQQIDYILSDIGARGVEMESLQQNLLDHICCVIENNLEANGDFESFYKKTIQTFYKDALWEIEEETILLLTFKNYYTMKKIMIISGTFSAIVMSIGILFKFMHWPGASACIVLGIVISSLVFLPLLFTLKAKEKQSIKDKLILGLATISGILISLAILFKIMHWPGANMMGTTFVIIMLALYIPLSFFSGIKNPEAKINTIVTTIIMIMGSGLFLTLVNLRPSVSIEKISIKQNKHLADCYEYATNQNNLIYTQLLSDSTSDKKNLTELKEKSDAICKQIEELKMKIFQATEQTAATKINYDEIYYPDNYDIPTLITWREDMMPKPIVTSLSDNLNKFNDYVKSTFNQNSASLIDLSDEKLPEPGVIIPWEMRNFYHVPLTCLLRNLNQLQIEIRLIESNCMK
jgi:hypothetical protein